MDPAAAILAAHRALPKRKGLPGERGLASDSNLEMGAGNGVRAAGMTRSRPGSFCAAKDESKFAILPAAPDTNIQARCFSRDGKIQDGFGLGCFGWRGLFLEARRRFRQQLSRAIEARGQFGFKSIRRG